MNVFFCLYSCHLLTRCSFQVTLEQTLNKVMPGTESYQEGKKKKTHWEVRTNRESYQKGKNKQLVCFKNLMESQKLLYICMHVLTLGSSFSLIFLPSFSSQKGT